MKVTLEGLESLPEVQPGDDLAALVAEAAPTLRDGDLVVITSKVVSKAEGRLVAAPDLAARDEVIAAETRRVVSAWDPADTDHDDAAGSGHQAPGGSPPTRIVVTHHGFVVAAAGVDASNTPPGTLVLLPVDPDASARRIRAALYERLGVRVGVLVTDTFGRPWRLGQTDVAVGAAGIAPLEDLRGRVDAWGNTLGVTVLAVADEIAAAADLVKRKLAGMPVAVVHGLNHLLVDDDGPGATALIRPEASDRFTLGTPEARWTGVWEAVLSRTPPTRPAAGLSAHRRPEQVGAAVQRVVAAVAASIGEVAGNEGVGGLTVRVAIGGGQRYVEAVASDAMPSPGLLVAAGSLLERVRVLARAEGLTAGQVVGGGALATGTAVVGGAAPGGAPTEPGAPSETGTPSETVLARLLVAGRA